MTRDIMLFIVHLLACSLVKILSSDSKLTSTISAMSCERIRSIRSVPADKRIITCNSNTFPHYLPFYPCTNKSRWTITVLWSFALLPHNCYNRMDNFHSMPVSKSENACKVSSFSKRMSKLCIARLYRNDFYINLAKVQSILRFDSL